ncbi:hypothetical protein C5167_006483 [Papaver somniferum]|uniref:Uncharacterized protein n=1 Tax=Papaver somniferum TaxID=3469 RepID=A0A4Y7JHN9_PAPSO|nr:hypothetical protein C5167_006483 [Papaver somniferum]
MVPGPLHQGIKLTSVLRKHGNLVDKENRPTEGPVTINVTSGASTQDKKRCYEAGNLWMDWSITSCHCAQLQQKNWGTL